MSLLRNDLPIEIGSTFGTYYDTKVERGETTHFFLRNRPLYLRNQPFYLRN